MDGALWIYERMSNVLRTEAGRWRRGHWSRRDLGPFNLEKRLRQRSDIPAQSLDSLEDLFEDMLWNAFGRPSVNVETGRGEQRLLEKSHRPRVIALCVGCVTAQDLPLRGGDNQ